MTLRQRSSGTSLGLLVALALLPLLLALAVWLGAPALIGAAFITLARVPGGIALHDPAASPAIPAEFAAVPPTPLAHGVRRYATPGGAGSGDCLTIATACTIARAIAAASMGDTLRLRPGTYLEKVLITKSGGNSGGVWHPIVMMSDNGNRNSVIIQPTIAGEPCSALMPGSINGVERAIETTGTGRSHWVIRDLTVIGGMGWGAPVSENHSYVGGHWENLRQKAPGMLSYNPTAFLGNIALAGGTPSDSVIVQNVVFRKRGVGLYSTRWFQLLDSQILDRDCNVGPGIALLALNTASVIRGNAIRGATTAPASAWGSHFMFSCLRVGQASGYNTFENNWCDDGPGPICSVAQGPCGSPSNTIEAISEDVNVTGHTWRNNTITNWDVALHAQDNIWFERYDKNLLRASEISFQQAGNRRADESNPTDSWTQHYTATCNVFDGASKDVNLNASSDATLDNNRLVHSSLFLRDVCAAGGGACPPNPRYSGEFSDKWDDWGNIWQGSTASPTAAGRIVASNTGFTNNCGCAGAVNLTTLDNPSELPAQVCGTGGGSTTPAAPTGLSATAISDTRIDLSWTDPNSGTAQEDATDIHRGATGFTPNAGNKIGEVGPNVTTFSNTGLTASTAYFFKVVARNDAGSSAASSQATATTQAAPGGTIPDPPTGLTVGTITASTIALTWTDPNSGANQETATDIHRATVTGFTPTTLTKVGEVTSDVVAFTATGLAPGTAYFFKAIARNAGGSSAASTEATGTTIAGVQPPSGPLGDLWLSFEAEASNNHPDSSGNGYTFTDSLNVVTAAPVMDDSTSGAQSANFMTNAAAAYRSPTGSAALTAMSDSVLFTFRLYDINPQKGRPIFWRWDPASTAASHFKINADSSAVAFFYFDGAQQRECGLGFAGGVHAADRMEFWGVRLIRSADSTRVWSYRGLNTETEVTQIQRCAFPSTAISTAPTSTLFSLGRRSNLSAGTTYQGVIDELHVTRGPVYGSATDSRDGKATIDSIFLYGVRKVASLPAVPQPLTVTRPTGTSGQLAIAVADSATNELKTYFYRGTPDKANVNWIVPVDSVGVTASKGATISLTHSGLPFGVQFCYGARAWNGKGFSAAPPDTACATTGGGGGGPDQPTVELENPAQGVIRVIGSAYSDPPENDAHIRTRYQLLNRKAPSLSADGLDEFRETAAKLTQEDFNLPGVEGHRYTARIRYIDANNQNSPFSDSTGLSLTIPVLSPVAQSISVVAPDSVILFWNSQTLRTTDAFHKVERSSGACTVWSIVYTSTDAATTSRGFGGLAPATYCFRVRTHVPVDALSYADSSSNSAALNVTIATPPTPGNLVTSPTSLTFTAQENQPSPPNQNVTLNNTGQTALTWTVSDDAAWLSTGVPSGSLDGESSSNVSVTAATGVLVAGTYNATITFDPSVGANDPVTVTFEVTAVPPPANLITNPTTLSFTAQEGATTNPATQPITLSNDGSASLTWTVADDAAWLTATGGTSPLVANTGTTTVTAAAAIAGLTAAGSPYTGTAVFTPSVGAPDSVVVTFTVTPPVVLPLNENLVLAYYFETGALASDSSGFGNHGTATAVTAIAGKTTGLRGKGAASFTTGSRITIPDSASLSFASAFSITGLTLLNLPFAPVQTIVGQLDATDPIGGDRAWQLQVAGVGGTPTPGATIDNATASAFYSGPGGAEGIVPVTYAATWDGATATVYRCVKGQACTSIESPTIAGPINNIAEDIVIGARRRADVAGGYDDFLLGDLDDLCGWRRELTATEVQTVADSGCAYAVRGSVQPRDPLAATAVGVSAVTSVGATLLASGYDDPDGDGHMESCWIISSGDATVDDACNDQLLSFTWAGGGSSTDYTWRVAFRDSTGALGPYSASQSFATLSAPGIPVTAVLEYAPPKRIYHFADRTESAAQQPWDIYTYTFDFSGQLTTGEKIVYNPATITATSSTGGTSLNARLIKGSSINSDSTKVSVVIGGDSTFVGFVRLNVRVSTTLAQVLDLPLFVQVREDLVPQRPTKDADDRLLYALNFKQALPGGTTLSESGIEAIVRDANGNLLEEDCCVTLRTPAVQDSRVYFWLEQADDPSTWTVRLRVPTSGLERYEADLVVTNR